MGKLITLFFVLATTSVMAASGQQEEVKLTDAQSLYLTLKTNFKNSVNCKLSPNLSRVRLGYAAVAKLTNARTNQQHSQKFINLEDAKTVSVYRQGNVLRTYTYELDLPNPGIIGKTRYIYSLTSNRQGVLVVANVRKEFTFFKPNGQPHKTTTVLFNCN